MLVGTYMYKQIGISRAILRNKTLSDHLLLVFQLRLPQQLLALFPQSGSINGVSSDCY